ncbi:MAG: 50S ribosomal protein L22 [Candidatus Aenigmarchaeota archaeon]|nr:50S ribosomal protein L22 [Candidatus Aenigmarchaeota archaeon]MCK5321966.1 50S ribosomal protein L22 [Candidatus Aenigmarchaeota archaeon]
MAKLKYAFKTDEKKSAKTSARNNRISWKDSVEICRVITGKNVNKMINYLTDVTLMKTAIPYKRFNKDLAHKKGIAAGKYPINTSKEFIKLLKNLINNADNKGLDTENLTIINAQANKGVTHMRGARMFGRRKSKSSNINIIAEERI